MRSSMVFWLFPPFSSTPLHCKRLQDQTRRLCDIDVNNIDWMKTKKKTHISYFNKTDKGKQFDCNIWKGFRNI